MPIVVDIHTCAWCGAILEPGALSAQHVLECPRQPLNVYRQALARAMERHFHGEPKEMKAEIVMALNEAAGAVAAYVQKGAH
jgi:hypothetical protein